MQMHNADQPSPKPAKNDEADELRKQLDYAHTLSFIGS
jgi:hypothetical protein